MKGESRVTDPMISTVELARMLGKPHTRTVDASWHLDARDALAEYRGQHVPGAVFFDIDAIADASSPLPHMLPTPETFAVEAGALGIAEDDDIVVYDSVGMFSAARVWWTFRAMGAARVRVLDGGLPKWIAEGRPLEAGDAAPAPTVFNPAFRPELVRDIAAVQRELADGGQIADARPAARFEGTAPELRPGLRSGHMPGARSLPLSAIVSADGTLKAKSDLQALFAEAGVDPGAPVTATCGSGITAAGIALALARLGNDRGAVYDGSWTEWGAHRGGAVVTGAA